jgi:hypothetical protein
MRGLILLVVIAVATLIATNLAIGVGRPSSQAETTATVATSPAETSPGNEISSDTEVAVPATDRNPDTSPSAIAASEPAKDTEPVGGRWLVPAGTEQLAVTPEATKPAESSAIRETVESLDEKARETPESARPGVVSETGETESETEKPSTKRKRASRTDDSEEESAKSPVQGTPEWITVEGEVISIARGRGSELRVTVKSRKDGSVEVLVAPKPGARVPGKGASVRVRGPMISEGKGGITVRAMEIDAIPGTRRPSPVPPRPVVVPRVPPPPFW